MQNQVSLHKLFQKLATFILCIALLSALPAKASWFDGRQNELNARQTHLREAVDTAHQLRADVPYEQIQKLAQSADEHAEMFRQAEAAGQTVRAAQEFTLARSQYTLAFGMAQVAPLVESRTVWLDRPAIVETKDEKGMAKLFDHIEHAGINTVVFECNNGGFAMYQSHVLEPYPNLAAGYDPLKTACAEAKKRKIKLIAWLWAFRVGNRDLNAQIGRSYDYAGPVISANPDLALKRDDGSYWTYGKGNECWISPANKDAREFVKSEILELVHNYEIAGIQLDYIRFPYQVEQEAQMGFDDGSRKAFKAETGIDLPKKAWQISESIRQSWIEWKTGKVTSFVKDIAHTLRQINPSLKLCAAVFPTPHKIRLQYIQQDWETWVNAGWIDILNPMAYSPVLGDYAQSAQFVKQSCQDKCLVVPGMHAGNTDAVGLADKIDKTRNLKLLGSAFFAYSILDESKQDMIGRGLYRKQVLLTPEADPLQASKLVFDDFALKATHCTDDKCVQALAAKGEIPRRQCIGGICQIVLALTADSNDVLEQIVEIENDLNKLTEFSTPQEIDAVNLKVADLKKKAADWLRLEKFVNHGGRADFLLGELDNVGSLLTYASQKAKVTK